MSGDGKQKFSWRAFASVLTGLSFLGMAFTGVILFVVPPGRIANWTGWTILGLTKHKWIGLHDWFSVIFILGAVLHTWLNWKALLSYFKDKLSKTFTFRPEWMLALVVCAVVSVGAICDVAPFSSLLAWNESIKHGWDSPARQAPIPDAELLTLAELAKHVEGVDLETMLGNLKAYGIEVDSPETIVGTLAEGNSMTPERLYSIALGQVVQGQGRGAGGRGLGGVGQGGWGGGHSAGSGGGPGGSGGGFGRVTLRQYCEQSGVDVTEAVRKLKDAGYEAGPDMTMRAIADGAGVHPSQIRMIFEPSVH